MLSEFMGAIYILFIITIVNLFILGLNIKLYTEYFKDVSARGRK